MYLVGLPVRTVRVALRTGSYLNKCPYIGVYDGALSLSRYIALTALHQSVVAADPESSDFAIPATCTVATSEFDYYVDNSLHLPFVLIATCFDFARHNQNFGVATGATLGGSLE